MKKTLLLLLLITPSLLSYGQHRHKKEPAELPLPRVWLGNIHTYYTTRDSILADPTLHTDSVGCRPSTFSISLQAPGHPFYGPIYATTPELTQAQKDLIKQWDYPDVTFYIQDIHLNCHEKDAVGNPITLKFSH